MKLLIFVYSLENIIILLRLGFDDRTGSTHLETDTDICDKLTLIQEYLVVIVSILAHPT